MIHAVHLPRYCDCVGSTVIATWLVCEGDAVSEGQPLCEVEADKVVYEVVSPGAGILRHILAEAGYAVPSGARVAVVADEADTIPADLLQAPPLNPPAPRKIIPTLIETEAPDARDGEIEPLDAMRSTVARRMTESKLSAPHFYLTTAIDMTACAELRQTLKAERIRATYNDMLIKACALALRKFPRVASLWSPEGYVPRDHMNVGFACAVEPEGLVVPVIHDADRKSLAQISDETKGMIKKAKDRSLTPADYAGGVFTVSNLGTFDVDSFTAIVNPGESAILAVGKMIDTPVAVRGAVAVVPLLKVTLSSDHRTVDGVLAARFNGAVKALMQDPAQLV